MGGKCFRDTVRLDLRQRDAVLATVRGVLDARGTAYRVPVEMAGKTDFGDVDVCVSDACRDAVRVSMAEALGCPEPFKASGQFDHFLTSDRHQVDLLYCPENELDMYCAGTSNGDLCMIVSCFVGRDLYLSERGLFLREPKMRLSCDPAAIARFLGFPPHALDGKTPMTVADVADVVERSRFFTTPPIYKRSRDKARRQDFSNFVDKWTDVPATIPSEGIVSSALDFFGARGAYDAAVAEIARSYREADLLRRCKQIVGGRLVASLRPELDGPGIGAVLARIRGGRTVEEYHDYLVGLTEDTLHDLVRGH
jgi:hypothetical protein